MHKFDFRDFDVFADSSVLVLSRMLGVIGCLAHVKAVAAGLAAG